MAKTVGDVILEARQLLQDQDSAHYRYPEADLYGYFNSALLEGRRTRPDLYRAYYGLATPEYTVADVAVDFPISNLYFQAFPFFVAGVAELRDDEFTVNNRAITLLGTFTSKMKGG